MGQEVQVVEEEQVAHEVGQVIHCEVAELKYEPEGQVDTQVVPYRYPVMQVRQVVVVLAQVAQGDVQG